MLVENGNMNAHKKAHIKFGQWNRYTYIIVACIIFSILCALIFTVIYVRHTASSSADTTITVFFSDQQYRSFSATRIRREIRRASASTHGHSVSYNFVRVYDIQEIEEEVNKRTAAERQLFVAFEEHFVQPFILVAPRFLSHTFYLIVEEDITEVRSANVHVYSLHTNEYDYLLGYFVSLLSHHQLNSSQLQNTTAIISDPRTYNEGRIDIVKFGLRSVDAQGTYKEISLDPSLTNTQIFNAFEKLKIDNTVFVILLTDTVPSVFVRAARKYNMLLITRATRRSLRGAHIIQRTIDWGTIINMHLLPHIITNRKVDIVFNATDAYYAIEYNTRYIRQKGSASLFIRQFDTIVDHVLSGRLQL